MNIYILMLFIFVVGVFAIMIPSIFIWWYIIEKEQDRKLTFRRFFRNVVDGIYDEP